jgi:hypothetical protein
VSGVVIGMDPHKRSATVEVMTADEAIRGGGRFGIDRDGHAAMLRYAKQWPDRVRAIEGCAGIGKHIANRLLTDGEQVGDVPPKLSATRVFATGQGRKTDATDAHPVALVGTRMAGPRPVVNDEQLTVLRILVDRRRSLGEDRTRMVSQLHQLLLELILGGAKKDLPARQAGDITRFPNGGNRQINRVLHIMARVQIRNPNEGRDDYDRKKADGKASMEAMRCVKRRLSDLVFQQIFNDAMRHSRDGPGRATGK